MDQIAAKLVSRGDLLFHAERVQCKFTGNDAADALLNDLEGHPHAFVLACLADRQVKAEVAWVIPYELSQRLGGFSFDLLRAVSRDDLRDAFHQPSKLHRFPDRVADVVYKGIQRIAVEYDGDASRIWSGEPPSAGVVLRFLRFDGVGPKIATMATNILAREFKVQMSDYYSIDVSVDVHLRRVFERLGLVQHGDTVEQVVYQARALHPPFPGLMDLPAWEIGRTWCRPTNPQCDNCYMGDLCPTAQAGKPS